MDNCLLSDSKNLPLWYVKVLSFFPSFRTYNNFYNNTDYELYQLISPKYGIYSLKSIYDIFNYHPILNTQNIKIVKYELNIITIFEYNKKTSNFDVVKNLDNSIKLDEDLKLLIDTLISNEPKIILTEQLIIGILYALKIDKLFYPNLYERLSGININLCLKDYKSSPNYDFIYHAFEDLLFKYGIHEKKERKRNQYKIEFNLPDSIILSNLIGGDKSILEFKNGKVKSSKNDIMYNTIILCILFSRYSKKSNFNKNPFSVEYVIKIFLDEFDINMREDLIMMIKILELEKVLYKQGNEFIITANYEDRVHKLFINSSYWWSINPDKSNNVILINNDNKNLCKLIYDIFDSLEDDNIIKILCYSGCDKSFIEEVSKFDKSLLFIHTLAGMFSSYHYNYSNFVASSDIKNFKTIELKYDIPIKLYMNNTKPQIDLGSYNNLNLTSIFSNHTIINRFNPSQTLMMDYNINKLKFKIIDLLKIDIAHYLLFIKDALVNKYVLYTADPNLKLLAHLYGSNFIYEKISNGKRYLELYTKVSSDFSLLSNLTH
jgi:hypothetical protein